MGAGLVLLLATAAVVCAEASTGIQGSVLDQSGARIAGAEIELYSARGFLERTGSGQDGRYEFPAVAAGQYKLRFSRPGFQTLIREVDVPQGGAEVPDITLLVATPPTLGPCPNEVRFPLVGIEAVPGRLAEVAGIIEPEGLPTSTAFSVVLSRPRHRTRKFSVIADPRGSFLFRIPLEAGVYSLRLSIPGHADFEIDVSLEPGRRITIRDPLPLKRCTGARCAPERVVHTPSSCIYL